MKVVAIICLILAGLSTTTGVATVIRGSANQPEGIENLVGYYVGLFLLPMIFLIVGLILLNKAKQPPSQS